MKNFIKTTLYLALSIICFCFSLAVVVNHDTLVEYLGSEHAGAPKVIIFSMLIAAFVWLSYSIKCIENMRNNVKLIFLFLFVVNTVSVSAQTFNYDGVIAEAFEDHKRVDSLNLKLTGCVVLGIEKIIVVMGDTFAIHTIEEMVMTPSGHLWIQLDKESGHIIFYEDYMMHCIPYRTKSGDTGMFRNKLYFSEEVKAKRT